MNIVVCLKQVPDPSSIEINPLTGQVDEDRLVYITNPTDLCALEAALRLKEEFGGTVSVITLGPVEMEKGLKEALARGADHVLRIWEYDWESVSTSHLVAYALALIIRKRPFDLIICGDGGGDFHAPQVPAWIAEYLDLPLITSIMELSFSPSIQNLTLKRKQERGQRQVMACGVPVVLAVTKFLNDPRECTLPNLVNSLQSSVPTLNLLLGTVARMIPVQVKQDIFYKTKAVISEPQVIYTPDNSLKAQERIDALITGGISEKKADLIQESPRQAAQRILDFLIANDVI